MSIPGLTTMRLLLEAAIVELGDWEAAQPEAGISVHRVANIRDKVDALRGCGSVGLLRTGMAHVADTISALGVPASELAPSLVRLTSLLDERSH